MSIAYHVETGTLQERALRLCRAKIQCRRSELSFGPDKTCGIGVLLYASGRKEFRVICGEKWRERGQAFPQQSANRRLGNISSRPPERCVESLIVQNRSGEVRREVEALSLATPAVDRRCSCSFFFFLYSTATDTFAPSRFLLPEYNTRRS